MVRCPITAPSVESGVYGGPEYYNFRQGRHHVMMPVDIPFNQDFQYPPLAPELGEVSWRMTSTGEQSTARNYNWETWVNAGNAGIISVRFQGKKLRNAMPVWQDQIVACEASISDLHARLAQENSRRTNLQRKLVQGEELLNYGQTGIEPVIFDPKFLDEYCHPPR